MRIVAALLFLCLTLVVLACVLYVRINKAEASCSVSLENQSSLKLKTSQPELLKEYVDLYAPCIGGLRTIRDTSNASHSVESVAFVVTNTPNRVSTKGADGQVIFTYEVVVEDGQAKFLVQPAGDSNSISKSLFGAMVMATIRAGKAATPTLEDLQNPTFQQLTDLGIELL